MSIVRIGPHTVEVTRRDKVFFPDAGLTKGDLIDYYRRIAPAMLPHLRGRPLTLHRFPEGLKKRGFIQQHAPDYFPEWIGRVTVEKEGGAITHVVCENEATLVYLANQGCITPHAWLSRARHLHAPDRLVFDLDPPGEDFAPVRAAAQWLHDLLATLGLPAFLMTTGSTGLHVVVPLKPQDPFDAVRAFAQAVAEALVRRHPSTLTVEQRKAKRRGRIFLDTLRNAYGQTAVAPYAVRARPGAPVATPLAWEELGKARLTPQRYTVQNIFRRLGQREDPWAAIDAEAVALDAVRRMGILYPDQ